MYRVPTANARIPSPRSIENSNSTHKHLGIAQYFTEVGEGAERRVGRTHGHE
jgi:hypothetical protein